MTDARRAGREGILLASLVRPACLIIDEVGHCEFDKENTRLFFDLVDRRYQKEGCYNMVFTSNRDPAQWQENFCESDALLCALDRIFDDAIVFSIKGESFRGKAGNGLIADRLFRGSSRKHDRTLNLCDGWGWLLHLILDWLFSLD